MLGFTLAKVIETFVPDFLSLPSQEIHSNQRKALTAICRCRTSALGGQRYRCNQCGHEHYAYHACRNRHCPRCQIRNQQDWLQKRLKELLPIQYFHVTFTIPREVANLFLGNQKSGYRILFRAASQTLIEFGQNNLGGKLGVIAVLHTWGQKLNYHPHIHCIVTAGGLDTIGNRWVSSHSKFLFPVKALRKVFKAKLLDLIEAESSMPSTDSAQILKAKAKTWGIDIQPPRQDPRALLLYLGRYIYRVAIDEKRILNIDREKRTVTFSYRDRAENGRTAQTTLQGTEFVRRFLHHILPKGMVKVRYYGIFAHNEKAQSLAQSLAALQKQNEIRTATLWCLESLLATIRVEETAQVCSHCKKGALVLVGRIESSSLSDPVRPP